MGTIQLAISPLVIMFGLCEHVGMIQLAISHQVWLQSVVRPCHFFVVVQGQVHVVFERLYAFIFRVCIHIHIHDKLVIFVLLFGNFYFDSALLIIDYIILIAFSF